MSAGGVTLEAVSDAPLRASRDRVDVWRAALDLAPAGAETALRTLSGAERSHAVRLRIGANRWVAARAALRGVLAHCLGVPPADIALVTGPDGKPRLAPGTGADLRFNLSHSGGMALVAVRLGLDVGVDLEEFRDDVDGEAVAREVLGEHERAALAAVPAEDRREAFFRAWVRHEALAKAAGRGIAAAGTGRDAERFRVRDLTGIAGFAAAVASEGDGWSVARVDARCPVPGFRS